MRTVLPETTAHQRVETLAQLLAEGYLRSRRGYAQGEPIGPVSRSVAFGATAGAISPHGGEIVAGGRRLGDDDPEKMSISDAPGLEVGARVGPHGDAR